MGSKRQVTLGIQGRTPGFKADNVYSMIIDSGPDVQLPRGHGLDTVCTSISPVKWDLFENTPNQSMNGKVCNTVLSDT